MPSPTAPAALRNGLWFALGSALLFGMTTPLIAVLGRNAGSASMAALLYAGAALGCVRFGRASTREPSLHKSQAWRLLLVALLGAALAPLCLAWGLKRTDAVSASLLLNFEALFTVLLAFAIYREHIGPKVAFAVLAMACGGVLLVFGSEAGRPHVGVGSVAILGATLAWALDNALSRPLAEFDPTQVVRWKATLGASFSVLFALLSRAHFPALPATLGLLLCGLTGYGLSLRLYLFAQRSIGAARTGSLFALAPFVGAALAWTMGQHATNGWSLPAVALFACGVYLHLTEKHDHQHAHAQLAHEHAHRHDDGHHDHHHDPPFSGEHSHRHRHEPLSHAHPHGDDTHHRHEHE